MNRFPNLTEQEKNKLLQLFLTSGTMKYDGESWSFHIEPDELLVALSKETEDLFRRAMKDLYDPV